MHVSEETGHDLPVANNNNISQSSIILSRSDQFKMLRSSRTDDIPKGTRQEVPSFVCVV